MSAEVAEMGKVFASSSSYVNWHGLFRAAFLLESFICLEITHQVIWHILNLVLAFLFH